MSRRRRLSPSDQFERWIARGEIKFAPTPLKSLTPWGQTIVQTYLIRAGVWWELGNRRVGRAYCLKLDDPVLQYVDILEDTREFLWCTGDHRDSIHPDDASIILIQRTNPAIKGRTIRSGDLRRMTIESPDGRQVIIDDLRGNPADFQ